SADVHGATKGGTRFNVGGKGIGTLGYNFTLPTNYNYETVTDGFSCLARCTSRSRRISVGFEPIHPPCIRVHTSSSTPMRLAQPPGRGRYCNSGGDSVSASRPLDLCTDKDPDMT